MTKGMPDRQHSEIHRLMFQRKQELRKMRAYVGSLSPEEAERVLVALREREAAESSEIRGERS